MSAWLREAIGNIREYLAGLDYDAFTRDKKTRDAAARNLEIIGTIPGRTWVNAINQTEDGKARINVRFEGETVWVSQKQLAELFQKDIRTINEHIRNIFEERELESDSVIRKFRITAADEKSYDTLRKTQKGTAKKGPMNCHVTTLANRLPLNLPSDRVWGLSHL